MNSRNRKGGRIPKLDKSTHCVMVRFNDVEFAKFLTLYERSGVGRKAIFIKARVFNESFRVVSIDRTRHEYYQKLSEMYAQFRGVATNYNQIVKSLKSNFTERKAMALLYKLEKETIEMVRLHLEMIKLTEQFDAEWSQK